MRPNPSDIMNMFNGLSDIIVNGFKGIIDKLDSGNNKTDKNSITNESLPNAQPERLINDMEVDES